jgi:hypothetical protein
MNLKGCGRKWLGSNMRYYPGIFLERLMKNHENLSGQLVFELRLEI